eukprot:Gb_04838 [translate_table: standard]
MRLYISLPDYVQGKGYAIGITKAFNSIPSINFLRIGKTRENNNMAESVKRRGKAMDSSEKEERIDDQNSEKRALLDSESSKIKTIGINDSLKERRSNSIVTQTLASTAHLANLLPTGTLLAFQILCPTLSNNGRCDPVGRFMTQILLTLCGISCFMACFTDSFRGSDGKIYYGFATPRGFWTFEYVNGGNEVPDPAKYKLRFVDFVHAFLSVLVFGAIALYDRNVVSCFYPNPKYETKEVLDVLPVAIGVICSLLFVVFPTTRHGIGYPVTT